VYENQKVGIMMPEIVEIMMVCRINVIPIDNGFDRFMKIVFMISIVILISEFSLI